MKSLSLDDIRRAQAASDPMFTELVIELASYSPPAKPITEKKLVWRDLRQNHSIAGLRGLSREQRYTKRAEDWKQVSVDELPERFQLYSVLFELHSSGGAWEREQLLALVARVPLRWGVWKALKGLYKLAESNGDRELFGALAARFDYEYARNVPGKEVRRPTLRYLVRRAWRHLNRLGTSLPSAYPDLATDVLRHYPANTSFRGTWVANHILFHHHEAYGGQKGYSRSAFRYAPYRPDLKLRAHPDAWRRSARPLFRLLERSEAELVRSYAALALKTDFRTQLREVQPEWVARLLRVQSPSVDSFVAWILNTVPRFEPGALRELGLHELVLRLLDSENTEAAKWAAGYARSHARDLPVGRLIELCNSDHKPVRSVARDLLKDRDARKEVGLEAWSRLLGTPHGHSLGVDSLRENFAAAELTLSWFTDLLLSGARKIVSFAGELLLKVHGRKTPTSFFSDLLDHERVNALAARFVVSSLDEKGLKSLDIEVVQRAIICPFSSRAFKQFVNEGTLEAKKIGAEFFKALADKSKWESSPLIEALLTSKRRWVENLEFTTSYQDFALKLLADHRTFSADDLGFDWLFNLVQRTDPELHSFALTTLTRSFHPSHFADQSDRSNKEQEQSNPKDADLQQKSFLFTGKLATMTRAQAQKMVIAAKGKKGNAVNGKLDFLVIGDEGSSLYGGGRKGSKQVKAERLIEKGSDLKIISETAFLQMLAGESVEVDEGAALAGCERLWQMLVSPGAVDEPLRAFALHYLTHHHAEIHMAKTDRPLDPGAELPDVFLTFDRAASLCADKRAALRELGLLWMRWELAKWSPPMGEIVALSEVPYKEVQAFVALALTADDSRKHRKYRLDPSLLTPEAAYRFCESNNANARAMGMKLIGLHKRLALPEELFRLTESPDRQMRAFVLRQLWSMYRNTGASNTWVPPVRKGEEPKAATPSSWPASGGDLRDCLRQTLFVIPPARPSSATGSRVLPAWRAKVAFVEVCRDLALDDVAFAKQIIPLFEEFTSSGGRSESAACLVALARIRATHSDLGEAS